MLVLLSSRSQGDAALHFTTETYLAVWRQEAKRMVVEASIPQCSEEEQGKLESPPPASPKTTESFTQCNTDINSHLDAPAYMNLLAAPTPDAPLGGLLYAATFGPAVTDFWG